MKFAHILLAGAGALGVGACSWGIKLDSGGRNVRVAWESDVTGCRDAGKVTVSVLDHVGPVDRSGMKVQDELEVMARNEAASLGADTIKPIGEPHDGEQSWKAYICGALARNADAPPPPAERAPREGAAETYPIKDH